MNGTALLRHGTSYGPYQLCRPCLRRYLHASRSFQASKPTVTSPARPKKPRRELVPPSSFKPYTEEDLKELAKKYTPQQIAAIKAAEEAVDPQDLAEQAMFRTNDPWLPEYFDDFSKHDLVLDKPLRAPEENYDPNIRFKTEDEIKSDFANWVANLPEEPTGKEYSEFKNDYRLTVGKEAAERNPINYMAPAIPKGVSSLQQNASRPLADQLDPEVERLVKATGFTPQEMRNFRSKTMVTHRVVNQTKLGKIQSMYVMTIVGNQNGFLGVGEGKSGEFNEARTAAYGAAIRNMKPIPRYERRTIYGDVRQKVGGTDVELYNRPPGFGIRCQHLIWEMCKCAGISDLAARVGRSRNPMNTIKATFEALVSQKIPEEIAMGLGRKLVDVRKVYYGGQV